MSPTVYALLRFVHILAMAVWFASGLAVAGDARRAVAAGGNHLEPLKQRLSRIFTTNAVASVVTVTTGLVLFLGLGGFKSMHPRYHASIALSLLSLALLFALIGPAMQQVTSDTGDRDAGVKRLAMVTGIDHLLKLVILFLMVYPFR